MAYEVFAIVTNEGRKALTQQLIHGEPAIQIVGFSVGEGGYEPSDPKTATAPDPNATKLEQQIFPLEGYKEYDTFELQNTFMPVFLCVLEHNEALGSLGEWGLWAKYVTGDHAGEVFLFAIWHSPVNIKTNADYIVARVSTSF